MKILNLCAGGNRVQSPDWINLDHLFPVLPEGSPERNNLLAESNYVEFDVLSGPLPFEDGAFDSVLASHCAEHWSCQDAVRVMRDCHRILKPNGVLLASVPDADIFRKHYDIDDGSNAIEIFGEPVFEGDGEKTFTGYALWNRFHRAIISDSVLWHYFKRAGFGYVEQFLTSRVAFLQNSTLEQATQCDVHSEATWRMAQHLNRIPFSLFMLGRKD